MGGLSEEREVSLRSGAAMAAALERKGYRVVRVDVDRGLPGVLVREGIEVAVLALHGPWGEDGSVQGLLEIMGIPYTGSGVAASAVCMDKALGKRLLIASGVPTPPWRLVHLGPSPDAEELAAVLGSVQELPGPWFVKPNGSGSSVGVGRADTREELEARLVAAARVSPWILVEAAIDGAEVTLPVLDEETFPLIQVQPKTGFYDYVNKYTAGSTDYLIPPRDVTGEALEQVRQVGLAAYRALGCRGLARVDLLVDREGRPWVLEINTIPGMTETSLAPKAAAAMGIPFDDLVERILRGAGVTACGG